MGSISCFLLCHAGAAFDEQRNGGLLWLLITETNVRSLRVEDGGYTKQATTFRGWLRT